MNVESKMVDNRVWEIQGRKSWSISIKLEKEEILMWTAQQGKF